MNAAPGIERLGPKDFRIRVKLRHNPRTGKAADRRQLVHGTIADAIRARDELEAKLKSTSTSRPRTRLRDYLLMWLQRRADTLKHSTKRRYLYASHHLLQALGDVYLEMLSRVDVDTYLGRRVAAGAAGNTVRNEFRLLRVAMRDAVDEGYITKSFCDRVKQPDANVYDDDDANLLEPAQVAKLVVEIPKQWLGLILFLITSGLRIGEATALRWEDVELEAGGLVRVNRNNDRGTETTTKTKKKRSVIALPEVVELFGCRRERGIIFPTRTGTMRKGSPLRAVLDKACAAAGVPRITAHGLRRTFNNIARRNTSTLVLQAMTGHATAEMTAHYSRVDAGEKTAVARAVLGVISVSGTRTGGVGK